MSILLDGIIITLCIFAFLFLYTNSWQASCNPHRDCQSAIPNSQAYILQNQVTHARLLPHASTHAFTYPTLSLLVSLNALESHSLDLGHGWIFSYAGLWCRLTGLRSNPYLTSMGPPSMSIKDKLERFLTAHGYEKPTLEDAWMMTMPSFLGYEGINPLTVYFCYKPRGQFWLTVLEIHNTFGEAHVHVLEVGKGEDEIKAEQAKGSFEHQWTFPREFHVSPFNDRSGFYTVSVKCPSHSPTHTTAGASTTPPRPAVRVHLHTASPSNPLIPGPLKLTALLRPVSATPLTAPSLLLALFRSPFALFLAFPQILYQAWILHYKKRLDVFIRPEPLPVSSERGLYPAVRELQSNSGGVKWISEGFLEKRARQRVESFLQRRVDETGISVTLIHGNPSVPTCSFIPSPSKKVKSMKTLKISYLSPRFFTILLTAPSPAHALLLGHKTEKLFFPSSPELFLSIFSPRPYSPSSESSNPNAMLLQRLRTRFLPPSFRQSIPIPEIHPLDEVTEKERTALLYVVSTLLWFDRWEPRVFRFFRARPVPGDEPWKQWDRAASIYSKEFKAKDDGIRRDLEEERTWVGSVRRDG